MLILIHTLDKLSSLSKCEPKHTHQHIYWHSHEFEISSNWLVEQKSQRTHCTFISNLCCAGSRRFVKPITGCCASDKAWQQLEHVALPSEGDRPKCNPTEMSQLVPKETLDGRGVKQKCYFIFTSLFTHFVNFSYFLFRNSGYFVHNQVHTNCPSYLNKVFASKLHWSVKRLMYIHGTMGVKVKITMVWLKKGYLHTCTTEFEHKK